MQAVSEELLSDIRSTVKLITDAQVGGISSTAGANTESENAVGPSSAEGLRLLLHELRAILLSPVANDDIVNDIVHDLSMDSLPKVFAKGYFELITQHQTTSSACFSVEETCTLLGHCECLLTHGLSMVRAHELKLQQQRGSILSPKSKTPLNSSDVAGAEDTTANDYSTDAADIIIGGGDLHYIVVLDAISATNDALSAVLPAILKQEIDNTSSPTAAGSPTSYGNDEDDFSGVPARDVLLVALDTLLNTLMVIEGMKDGTRLLRQWDQSGAPLALRPLDAHNESAATLPVLHDAKATELVVGSFSSSATVSESIKLIIDAHIKSSSVAAEATAMLLDFIASQLVAPQRIGAPALTGLVSLSGLLDLLQRPRLTLFAAKLLSASMALEFSKPEQTTTYVSEFVAAKGVTISSGVIGHFIAQAQGGTQRGGSANSTLRSDSNLSTGSYVTHRNGAAPTSVRDIVPLVVGWVAAPLAAAMALPADSECCSDAYAEMKHCYSYKDVIAPSLKTNSLLSSGLGTLHSLLYNLAPSNEELRIIGDDILVLSQAVDVSPSTKRHFSSEKANVTASWAIMVNGGGSENASVEASRSPSRAVSPGRSKSAKSNTTLCDDGIVSVCAATVKIPAEAHGPTVALVKRNIPAPQSPSSAPNTRPSRNMMTRRNLTPMMNRGAPLGLKPCQCIVFETPSSQAAPLEVTVMEERAAPSSPSSGMLSPPRRPPLPEPAVAIVSAATNGISMKFQKRVPKEAAAAGHLLQAAAPGFANKNIGPLSPTQSLKSPRYSDACSRQSSTPGRGRSASPRANRVVDAAAAKQKEALLNAEIATLREQLLQSQQQHRVVEHQRDEVLNQMVDLRTELGIAEEQIIAPLRDEVRALRHELGCSKKDARVAMEAATRLAEENEQMVEVLMAQTAAIQDLEKKVAAQEEREKL